MSFRPFCTQNILSKYYQVYQRNIERNIIPKFIKLCFWRSCFARCHIGGPKPRIIIWTANVLYICSRALELIKRIEGCVLTFFFYFRNATIETSKHRCSTFLEFHVWRILILLVSKSVYTTIFDIAVMVLMSLPTAEKRLPNFNTIHITLCTQE